MSLRGRYASGEAGRRRRWPRGVPKPACRSWCVTFWPNTVGVGQTYLRGMPADLCRSADEQNHQQHDAPCRHEQSDRDHEPAGQPVARLSVAMEKSSLVARLRSPLVAI